MAVEHGESPTEYIAHHLTHLKVGSGFWTWHVDTLFMSALLAFVRAGIYGGLHEDTVTEMKWMEVANGILKDARARSDQEEPKRAMFNHRITAARRIRRPWPPVSNEWGGTGSPG